MALWWHRRMRWLLPAFQAPSPLPSAIGKRGMGCGSGIINTRPHSPVCNAFFSMLPPCSAFSLQRVPFSNCYPCDFCWEQIKLRCFGLLSTMWSSLIANICQVLQVFDMGVLFDPSSVFIWTEWQIIPIMQSTPFEYSCDKFSAFSEVLLPCEVSSMFYNIIFSWVYISWGRWHFLRERIGVCTFNTSAWNMGSFLQ